MNKFQKKDWGILVLAALVIFATATLGSSIMQRKYETQNLQTPRSKVAKQETRNHEYSLAYPKHVDSYLEAMLKGNSSTTVTDELSTNPSLVILWAGYGFSKDYNKPRGHPYAVVDTINSLRTGAPKDKKSGPMPATCMTCKSPDVPRLMEKEGVAEFYEGKWARHVEDVVNPIGCADCHNSETMALQISRPALKEAFARQGKDISQASHQEMRSLVCAQCHVEYYFKKPGAYLTFPWDKGLSVEAMEEYFDDSQFSDWTHKVSKAPMLKAQHPGYEIFQQGIHAKRGVACADCHMPYKTVGGSKISDHHVRSPLSNVSNSCQQCHRTSEAELLENVASLKTKVEELKSIAERELVKAHLMAGKAWEVGATKKEMAKALTSIRHAQWRWDYATASHGAYFHAPEESLRIIGTSIHKASEAVLSLSLILQKKGVTLPMALPDYSTKTKAQTLIGLDEPALSKAKKSFISTLVRKWWDSSSFMDEKMRKKVEGELQQ